MKNSAQPMPRKTNCVPLAGHKDGGALVMKTYGHLRREHGISQAQRVSFAPVMPKQTAVIPFPVTA